MKMIYTPTTRARTGASGGTDQNIIINHYQLLYKCNVMNIQHVVKHLLQGLGKT